MIYRPTSKNLGVYGIIGKNVLKRKFSVVQKNDLIAPTSIMKVGTIG